MITGDWFLLALTAFWAVGFVVCLLYREDDFAAFLLVWGGFAIGVLWWAWLLVSILGQLRTVS